MKGKRIQRVEVGTLLLLAGCYLTFAGATVLLPQVSTVLAFLMTTLAIAFHSSLQHEALHGHPTRNAAFNEVLVILPVGLLIPYRRFRDLHMAHHHDEILTDPYDDPESNFLDPQMWQRMAWWKKAALTWNNTLLGRIVLGPAISEMSIVRQDFRAAVGGDGAVIRAWGLHFLGLGPVLWWVLAVGTLPVWAYLLAAYFGFGLLKIRTYLEHRANANPAARTVIIEDHGPLSFLFLNNNLHAVHHANPGAPWYRLPSLYDENRETYQRQNQGYFYKNYAEVFRKHLFWAKDPVAHPLMGKATAAARQGIAVNA